MSSRSGRQNADYSRRKKRLRNGIMSVRWVQTRERNEALDLVCMILCCALTYRGAIDMMEVQTVGETVSTASAAPKRESAFGVLPGSEQLAGQLGLTSQVVRQRDPGERRPWGVQPSNNIW
jgi:phage terminase large subunit GpA-like protein